MEHFGDTHSLSLQRHRQSSDDHYTGIIIKILWIYVSHTAVVPGGLVIIVLATGLKVRGFNPGR
jgi:hypothetical protein